jgi:hypothetical protein
MCMPGPAAPKTFLDNRDGHLQKAAAFRAAARTRLSDNLPYRTAVSDAMESVRHALQAYLWSRVATQYPREPVGRWQEAATKGSMPELLSCASEAGLALSTQQQQDIMKLVRARNSYTHDSPQSGMLITREVAEKAVSIAAEVDRKTEGGKAAQPVEAVASDRRVVAVVEGPRLAQVAGSPIKPAPAAPASRPATPAEPPAANDAADAEADDDPDDGAITGSLPTLGRGRRRLWTSLGIAAALVLGLLAGTAVTYPVASGEAALPGWVPFAHQLVPATATPLPTATATATYTGPRVAGNLLITPSACGAAQPTITLRNTGATAIAWAAGSPDAASVQFVADAHGAPRSTLTGTLAPDAAVTLTVSGLASGGHVVVIADGGTVELALPAC